MKRFTLFSILSIISLLSLKAQSAYDPINAEIISNRLKENITLTKQQATQAVDYAISGMEGCKSGGELLLDTYPPSSDWYTFHKAFESIEKKYDASFVIIKNVDKLKKLLTESQFAKLTIAIREYDDWYSRFCKKQKVYTDCPYK